MRFHLPFNKMEVTRLAEKEIDLRRLVIKETTKVADYDAVIPMITGSAYLTGVATYLIDPTDPLKYGFQVG